MLFLPNFFCGCRLSGYHTLFLPGQKQSHMSRVTALSTTDDHPLTITSFAATPSYASHPCFRRTHTLNGAPFTFIILTEIAVSNGRVCGFDTCADRQASLWRGHCRNFLQRGGLCCAKLSSLLHHNGKFYRFCCPCPLLTSVGILAPSCRLCNEGDQGYSYRLLHLQRVSNPWYSLVGSIVRSSQV